MRNEKQIQKIQKTYLPKDLILKAEGKDRELTKDELKVMGEILSFYRHQANGFEPITGLKLPAISCKASLDFAFTKIADTDGKFYIYLNLK